MYQQAVAHTVNERRIRTHNRRKPSRMYPDDPPALFVVRNTRKAYHKMLFEMLKELNIWNYNTGIFMRHTAESKATLNLLSPFVYFGEPSALNVRELVVKHAVLHPKGDGEMPAEPIPLKDNNVVEEHFSDLGLVCIEDIVDQLRSGGEHFDEVCNRLGHFPLFNLQKVEGITSDDKHYWGRKDKDTFNAKLTKII
eukprot:Platyproteum_vivax@DN3465_c0_g1_i1.p1